MAITTDGKYYLGANGNEKDLYVKNVEEDSIINLKEVKLKTAEFSTIKTDIHFSNNDLSILIYERQRRISVVKPIIKFQELIGKIRVIKLNLQTSMMVSFWPVPFRLMLFGYFDGRFSLIGRPSY